jgi:[acyl-carrier-protein] S-malonyltransferase
MTHSASYAFLFPGQGAQYVGMGKDFFEQFQIARQTYQQADEILDRPLSKLIFSGSEQEITQTKNSQPAIFVTSIAILRVLNELFPEILPSATSGLSLGEYTALVAAGYIDFSKALPLVQLRGQFMHDSCENNPGTMAVVLGLEDAVVEECVNNLSLPNDLWAANFNCPGQVVISGTKRGIDAATVALIARGAKRVLPLQVHGAFHSGLMNDAQEKLKPYILSCNLLDKSRCKIAMNVSGSFATSASDIKNLLIDQVTSPVRWSTCVRTMDSQGPAYFIEIGCGKTLSGMNKRIVTKAPTLSLEKIDEIGSIEKALKTITV